MTFPANGRYTTENSFKRALYEIFETDENVSSKEFDVVQLKGKTNKFTGFNDLTASNMKYKIYPFETFFVGCFFGRAVHRRPETTITIRMPIKCHKKK